MHLNFFKSIGERQYLVELFIASIVLSLLLSLAEAQSCQNVQWGHVISYILYINWVILAFVAAVDVLRKKLRSISPLQAVVIGFVLLQVIILLSSTVLNMVIYYGRNFSLQNFSYQVLINQLVLHSSYGVLLGAFCLRYIYVRDEWLKQQNSELNAKVQAL